MATANGAHQDTGPSVRRLLQAGLIGVGVSLLCFLPPGIHFISGPLGPLIGGCVAGTRAQARRSDAIVIGTVMGLGETIVAGILALIIYAVVSNTDTHFTPGLMGIIAAGVWLHAAILGTVGALVGGWFARKD